MSREMTHFMVCVILFQNKFAFKVAQYLQYLNLQFKVFLFSIFSFKQQKVTFANLIFFYVLSFCTAT